MSSEVKDLRCPGCGARVDISTKICKYCRSPIVISTFSDIASFSAIELNKHISSYNEYVTSDRDNVCVNKALGICYLKMGLYDKAIEFLDNATRDSINDSELYYYLAISQLKGKRPFSCLKCDVDKALQYLEIAVSIEQRGIYYYLAVYIVRDFYKRKFLKYNGIFSNGNYLTEMSGYSEYDKELLRMMMKQESI